MRASGAEGEAGREALKRCIAARGCYERRMISRDLHLAPMGAPGPLNRSSRRA